MAGGQATNVVTSAHYDSSPIDTDLEIDKYEANCMLADWHYQRYDYNRRSHANFAFCRNGNVLIIYSWSLKVRMAHRLAVCHSASSWCDNSVFLG